MQEFTTIKEYATAEFIERRSHFIGAVKPVTSEELAVAFINEKKAEHWDAAHNVYAYILRDGQTKRYSDDGEPQGTAGIPVLNVLQKEGLTDIAVVVTRYFGGVLLGAGGLVRAYSQGAKIAVDASKRIIMSECTELSLECGYDFYGKLSYILPKHGAYTTTSDFGAVVRLTVLMKNCNVNAFEKELLELFSGLIIPQVVGYQWNCLP